MTPLSDEEIGALIGFGIIVAAVVMVLLAFWYLGILRPAG